MDQEIKFEIVNESTSLMMTSATTSVRVVIAGMTCQKCERLIREALLENVDGVVGVDVHRSDGYANVEVKSQAWTTQRHRLKGDIVRVIQELVNGKFKAKIVDDASTTSASDAGKIFVYFAKVCLSHCQMEQILRNYFALADDVAVSYVKILKTFQLKLSCKSALTFDCHLHCK